MWTKLSADKKSELMKAYKKGGFSYRDMIDDYNNSYEEFEKGGKVEFNSGGETHVVYRKESPTGNGKGIEGHIMINHPTKDKGKWDTIDLTDISNYKVKTIDQGIASTKKWHAENPEYKMGGIQKFGPGGKTKLDTSNWEQSSLDSLNLYNKFYLPLEPGEARRPLTQEEKELYKDEKTGIRPISMTYKISNPTAWGYAGNFPKPVGVQKKPVQATPYIDPNLNKPVKPTGPTKYQTSGGGKNYYNVNGNWIPLEEYNKSKAVEINRTTGLPINMYGGIQRFEEGGIEESINKSLGNPMLKAEIDSDYKRPTVDPRTRRQKTSEPVDNVRHAAAGRYTQEAIENYANLIPYASAIPGFSKAAGFIGSNILGLGHEASTLFNNDDDTRTMGMKVKESAADAYNNMIGSVIGASNLTPYQKKAYMKYLSETGKMPTGQYNKKKDPTYKKEMGGIQRYEVGGETKPPVINMSLMGKQYNPSETSNQPVNDVYKKTYINTDPDIIGEKYWEYRNPENDSEIENTLEYAPYIGSVLSVNDAMNAYRNAYKNPGVGTYSSAALETLGMFPLGKGFNNKSKEFITNAIVQGMSDLAEYVQKPKTKKNK